MTQFISLFKTRRELISILVERNLKIRYKNSALGFFWSLLTPALYILMYAIFASILKFNNGQPDYLAFLVAGIIIWQFTAGCLNDSLNAIVGNTNLVKKVAFPRIILPLSTALANGINFALTLVILIIYLAIDGVLSLSNIYLLIPALVMHLMLCIGIACICSTSNVFFRDTQHIIGVGSLAWFFLSPVFYSIDLQLGAIGAMKDGVINQACSYAGIIYLNPMTGILSTYRAALMNGHYITPPGLSPYWILLSFTICLMVFIGGLISLHCGEKSFGDVL